MYLCQIRRMLSVFTVTIYQNISLHLMASYLICSLRMFLRPMHYQYYCYHALTSYVSFAQFVYWYQACMCHQVCLDLTFEYNGLPEEPEETTGKFLVTCRYFAIWKVYVLIMFSLIDILQKDLWLHVIQFSIDMSIHFLEKFWSYIYIDIS